MDDMRWASHVSLSTKVAVELDQSTNTAINKHLSENPTKNQGFIDVPVARCSRGYCSRGYMVLPWRQAKVRLTPMQERV